MSSGSKKPQTFPNKLLWGIAGSLVVVLVVVIVNGVLRLFPSQPFLSVIVIQVLLILATLPFQKNSKGKPSDPYENLVNHSVANKMIHGLATVFIIGALMLLAIPLMIIVVEYVAPAVNNFFDYSGAL